MSFDEHTTLPELHVSLPALTVSLLPMPNSCGGGNLLFDVGGFRNNVLSKYRFDTAYSLRNLL